MNVKCDNCQHEFEINLQIRTVEKDIELNYFVCPNCNHKYHSFYTNAKIRNRQEKIQGLRKKLNELVVQNTEEMQALKRRYEDC